MKIRAYKHIIFLKNTRILIPSLVITFTPVMMIDGYYGLGQNTVCTRMYEYVLLHLA